MTQRFSQRNSYNAPIPEITVRNDAPAELRSVLVDIAYEAGFRPRLMRTVVCRVLRLAPNPDNWSDFPNVDGEVRYTLEDCNWFRVYDIIEEIYAEASRQNLQPGALHFAKEINDYFAERGIGWQLLSGKIETRGADVVEDNIQNALAALANTVQVTAYAELREAKNDLSRRPNPDVTGTIQHSMAALECLSRDITGDTRATLGQIISNHPGVIPKPLDQAIEKAWGYASETGRHLQEGRIPSYEEC